MLRLDVINSALIIAGQPEVTTLEETKASRTLSSQYPHSLKSVFSAHPWDVLKLQATLTAIEDETPAFDYTYSFLPPIDFIRIVEEYPTGYDYDRVRGKIYANTDTISLTYVAFPYTGTWAEITDIDDVANWYNLGAASTGMGELLTNIQFDDMLLDCVTSHMVFKSIYKITGDHGDTSAFERQYNIALAKAKSVTAQQKRDMTLETSDWIGARG